MMTDTVCCFPLSSQSYCSLNAILPQSKKKKNPPFGFTTMINLKNITSENDDI